MTATPTILVVDDEEQLADLYAEWLSDEYTVKTAYRGQEALTKLDSDVDVVLLDRRMPDIAGDEVLETIRERDLTCRVAMVTAVEPDFDIIEMGYDDYLVKPVDTADLHSTVEELLELNTYDTKVQELYSLSSKVATLEQGKSESELAQSEEYQRLKDRLDRAREEADTMLDGSSAQDFRQLF